MKKIILLFILVFLFFFCGEKSNEVEKLIEDGVEVVINHLEPYKIKGQPSTFTLEEGFFIDFEREDLANLGIGEIWGFDVDSKGNVYCLTESQIFKFDNSGHFIRKFGQKGQGPGEFIYPEEWWITENDEFALYDRVNSKFIFFREDGEFLKAIKIPSKIITAGMVSVVLPGNEGFLFDENLFDREVDNFYLQLIVLDADFNKTKALMEKVNRVNPFKSAKINLFTSYIRYQISKDKIYSISQENPDFEINIYNFQGENIKKIRKEFKKMRIPEDYKTERMDSYKESTMYRVHKMKAYFQEYFPPIKNFFIDTQGRIYIETYEEGKSPDYEIVDIFNAEGIFIGRASLKKALSRIFKIDRMHVLYEKESGFQKLVVSNMIWN
jgi:hypothetical protein